MILNFLSTIIFINTLSYSLGCRNIFLQSDQIGDFEFELAPVDIQQGPRSGRPVYISDTQDGTIYLYHITADTDYRGVGRWVVNNILGDKATALAYIDSWAVTPHLIQALHDNDKIGWATNKDGEWVLDKTFTVYCNPEDDNTIFFDSPYAHTYLSGFYVQTIGPIDGSYSGPLFTKVQEYEQEDAIYLFRFENRWLIGNNFHEDSCRAFLELESDSIEDLGVADWNFVNEAEPGFFLEYSRIIQRTDEYDDIYRALHITRSIPSIPKNQSYITLRNNVPMPTIGLGTGGLVPGEETYTTMETANKLGYRMFDLAREYRNEKTLASIFNATRSDEKYALREETFIITKVWPTELGFLPTSDAIYLSLQDLNTNYIDMYLIHWPLCNPSIDWMHCETTVDPDGNWKESWYALEKAYAEGRVNSIGVSNFNRELLDEMSELSSVRPHLVQNHGEPGITDLTVREWCFEHNVVYQPYASLRNLKDSSVLSALKKIASERAVTEQFVAIKFFVQTGASVIPRTKNPTHLQANLDVFSNDFKLTPAEMASLGWNEIFNSNE